MRALGLPTQFGGKSKIYEEPRIYYSNYYYRIRRFSIGVKFT